MNPKQNTTPTPRALVNPTLYTMPSPAALSAEAKAEGAGESVMLALCEVCHQPTAESVIKSYNQVIEELHDSIADKSGEINFLKADNAKLVSENEWLTKQLEKNEYIATPDGDLPLWLPALICFVFALVGLGAAHYAMKIIAVLLGLGGAV